MTTFETDSKILKDYLTDCINDLEKGEAVYLRGNYSTYSYESSVIDSNCRKLANKLSSLGYEHTTNHGFGCLDYKFLKAIEL